MELDSRSKLLPCRGQEVRKRRESGREGERKGERKEAEKTGEGKKTEEDGSGRGSGRGSGGREETHSIDAYIRSVTFSWRAFAPPAPPRRPFTRTEKDQTRVPRFTYPDRQETP